MPLLHGLASLAWSSLTVAFSGLFDESLDWPVPTPISPISSTYILGFPLTIVNLKKAQTDANRSIPCFSTLAEISQLRRRHQAVLFPRTPIREPEARSLHLEFALPCTNSKFGLRCRNRFRTPLAKAIRSIKFLLAIHTFYLTKAFAKPLPKSSAGF